MPAVLVVSSGLFHPPILGRLHLWRALRSLPRLHLKHASSIEAAARLPGSQFQAVVLYLHRQRISPAALDGLERFVREGGGVLAVHSATASFKENRRYGDILGGHFTGHPPVGSITVRQSRRGDEVFGVVPEFALHDEAYRHELRDDIRVHFTVTHQATGETQPFVWTRRHGAGRVCYVGAGHVAGSLRHPRIVALLRGGLTWVCGTTMGR